MDEVKPQSTTTSDKDTSNSTPEENNTVSFWAKVAMPIAAVLAIAFYINQIPVKGGNSIAQKMHLMNLIWWLP